MKKMSCENIRIGDEGEFAKIMLASLPGSGNTWVRFLLDRLLGVYSGAVASDKSLYRGGLLGEVSRKMIPKNLTIRLLQTILLTLVGCHI